MKYRSRPRLVLDVLRAVQIERQASVTRIMSVANISHPRLMEYLEELRGKGWLEETGDEGRRTWRLTDAGATALRRLVDIERSMDDFGLPL